MRVRCTAAARGLPDVYVRRGLVAPVGLREVMPVGEVAVQAVLVDEAAGYERHSEVFAGSLGRAGDAGLWLEMQGAAVVVGRLPAWAAYPRPRGYARLFTLGAAC